MNRMFKLVGVMWVFIDLNTWVWILECVAFVLFDAGFYFYKFFLFKKQFIFINDVAGMVDRNVVILSTWVQILHVTC